MSAMTAVLRSEYRKLATTRNWWVLLLVMAAYMAFMAGVLGFGMTQAPDSTQSGGLGTDSPQMAISIYTIAVATGYVFPVIVGALSVTGEFRHQTITPTFLAEPSRTRVLVAKILAAVPVGLVYGVAGVGVGFITGAGILAVSGHDTYLSDGDVQAALARAVLAMVVWTLFGVALGSAISNQVAVIVITLAFTQFLEPILRLVLGMVAGGDYASIAAYLPGAAGEALTGSSIYSQSMDLTLLSWWQGLLVLLAYVAVLAGIGRATTFRRDIT